MKHRYLIAIDIGNTNVTVGVFKGPRLIAKGKIPTAAHGLYEKSMKRLLKKAGCLACKDCVSAVSSVVPAVLPMVKKTLRRIGVRDIYILGKDIKVPIKNLYACPEEVGQDRLVNAFAARELYGAPAVVIDFGTAVTFDCVSKKGEYLGGLILPGIDISLQSLYEKTALLPKIRLKTVRQVIGRTTADSMRAGILFGFGSACDGLVEKYKKLLGEPLRVIDTGGNSGLVRRYARSIKTVDEDLTLKGIRLGVKK